MSFRMVGLRPVALGLLAFAAVSCGKKGPPLPPMRIAPAAVTDLSARRIGDRVQLRFTLPERNTDNSTPADIGRVDVYALSVEKPADAPVGDEFLREGTRVASVTPNAEETSATAVETLTEDAFRYYAPKTPARPAPLSADTIATDAKAAAVAAAEPQVPVRVYTVVPVSTRNHRGRGTLVNVPLVDVPGAPPAPAATYTDKAISLTWDAVEGADTYNVYEVPDEKAAPVTPLAASTPGATAYDDTRVTFGTARCYRITTVKQVNKVPVESVPSDPVCVTPIDTFAPPAPTGLGAVAGPGTISLIWDAVNASDLAGYVVLRGTAPGDTLQALTPDPIKETTFRDATVTPGQRYVYAVVAMDQAKNTSAQSARVEETARQ